MAVVVNYGRTLTELGRYWRRMDKPTGGLKRVGQYLKGLSQQAFRGGKDPTTGDAWAELRPVTIELRKKGKGSGTPQILVDSSGLRKSIVAIITGRNKVAVGASKVYGAMHQFGGVTSSRSMIPGKRIPARPFLGFDKKGGKEIERIMKRWILGET
jgi:phage virion morphogenesis protein